MITYDHFNVIQKRSQDVTPTTREVCINSTWDGEPSHMISGSDLEGLIQYSVLGKNINSRNSYERETSSFL